MRKPYITPICLSVETQNEAILLPKSASQDNPGGPGSSNYGNFGLYGSFGEEDEDEDDEESYLWDKL